MIYTYKALPATSCADCSYMPTYIIYICAYMHMIYTYEALPAPSCADCSYMPTYIIYLYAYMYMIYKYKALPATCCADCSSPALTEVSTRTASSCSCVFVIMQ